MPYSAGERDPFRLVAAWLLEQPVANTRTAYARDIGLLLDFLTQHNVDLLAAARGHVAAWAESMRRSIDKHGNRRIGEATIKRRLSAVSSFFTYAAQEGAIEASPVRDMKRPRHQVDEDGIAWLNHQQMMEFLAAAEQDSPRAHAITAVMLTTGARTSEVLAAKVSDLGYTGGHRVLTVTRKGGKRQHLVIAPWVGAVIDAYLNGRTDGPVFATHARERRGGYDRYGHMDEPSLHRLVRRIARRAGLLNANQLHPHSLRHSALTAALERGCTLRDVQTLAGHADPRTTERYDRMRSRLDRSPVYALAASLAGSEGDRQ